MGGPFHAGERALQKRAGVPDHEAAAIGRAIRDRIVPAVARVIATQRFAVLSSLDGAGRVWASLLTGEPGYVTVADTQLLRLAAHAAPGDPLAENLATRPELGVLLIDLETRQRIRLNGRAIHQPDGFYLLVSQVYGNCPKYIQKRVAVATDARAGRKGVRLSHTLLPRHQAWIRKADTFFIASFHPQGGADASHRGGRPGFVRVDGPRRLAFAHYPGNGMFNTLGNLAEYARAGLLFVDFETGDLLQMTGRAGVGADFEVNFDVDAVRETPAATPFRWRLVESIPANPPLSHLPSTGI